LTEEYSSRGDESDDEPVVPLALRFDDDEPPEEGEVESPAVAASHWAAGPGSAPNSEMTAGASMAVDANAGGNDVLVVSACEGGGDSTGTRDGVDSGVDAGADTSADVSPALRNTAVTRLTFSRQHRRSVTLTARSSSSAAASHGTPDASSALHEQSGQSGVAAAAAAPGTGKRERGGERGEAEESSYPKRASLWAMRDAMRVVEQEDAMRKAAAAGVSAGVRGKTTRPCSLASDADADIITAGIEELRRSLKEEGSRLPRIRTGSAIAHLAPARYPPASPATPSDDAMFSSTIYQSATMRANPVFDTPTDGTTPTSVVSDGLSTSSEERDSSLAPTPETGSGALGGRKQCMVSSWEPEEIRPPSPAVLPPLHSDLTSVSYAEATSTPVRATDDTFFSVPIAAAADVPPTDAAAALGSTPDAAADAAAAAAAAAEVTRMGLAGAMAEVISVEAATEATAQTSPPRVGHAAELGQLPRQVTTVSIDRPGTLNPEP
jgi:hypothetical protein